MKRFQITSLVPTSEVSTEEQVATEYVIRSMMLEAFLQERGYDVNFEYNEDTNELTLSVREDTPFFWEEETND